MTKVVEEKPDNPAADSEVVSTSDAARQLGVSVRTIQLWVESGRLAAWKTAGNHRRIYQYSCLLYTSPSPRDATLSRMPSSA